MKITKHARLRMENRSVPTDLAHRAYEFARRSKSPKTWVILGNQYLKQLKYSNPSWLEPAYAAVFIFKGKNLITGFWQLHNGFSKKRNDHSQFEIILIP